MKKDEITSIIMLSNPDSWRFICATLDIETIENEAERWAIESEQPPMKSAIDELFEGEEWEWGDGIDEKKLEHWELCRNILMQKATKIMWKSITEKQIMDLFNNLRKINAKGITMANGIEYETFQILNDWKNASEAN